MTTWKTGSVGPSGYTRYLRQITFNREEWKNCSTHRCWYSKSDDDARAIVLRTRAMFREQPLALYRMDRIGIKVRAQCERESIKKKSRYFAEFATNDDGYRSIGGLSHGWSEEIRFRRRGDDEARKYVAQLRKKYGDVTATLYRLIPIELPLTQYIVEFLYEERHLSGLGPPGGVDDYSIGEKKFNRKSDGAAIRYAVAHNAYKLFCLEPQKREISLKKR